MLRALLLFFLFTGFWSCDLRIKEETQTLQKEIIPQKVYDTYAYIKKNDKARKGYVGGREFRNFEKLLPIKTKNGSKIRYREWDVNPKKKGKNRGKERIVTGNDGKAYYTNDHYQSFIEIE